MDKPTDINEYRKRNLDRPDEDQIFVDDEGMAWFEYTASYIDHRGKEMVFHLWAISHNDAVARLKQIGESGKINGQVFSKGDL